VKPADPQTAALIASSPAEFLPACGACATPLRQAVFPADIAFALVRAEFGIARDDLVSAQRTDRLVTARAYFVWVLATLGRRRSYPQIGALLGGRNHSTIINLHRKAIGLRLNNAAFAAACLRIGTRWRNQGALPDATRH
jgi:Bacterial dnaA protein helix-turn-helix